MIIIKRGFILLARFYSAIIWFITVLNREKRCMNSFTHRFYSQGL